MTHTIGKETLSLIHKLARSGVTRMSVLVRHSERHYDPDFRKEPFLGLTENGKDAALTFGKDLPARYQLHLYSSMIGRCIETAYLVDKGYASCKGSTISNILEDTLSPFYIVNIKASVARAFGRDVHEFIREWFSGEIPENEMMPARLAAEEMIRTFAAKLKSGSGPAIHLGVTHDWNVYLVREFGLSLRHEEIGEVAFMEGTILYVDPENPERVLMAHALCDPRPVQL